MLLTTIICLMIIAVFIVIGGIINPTNEKSQMLSATISILYIIPVLMVMVVVSIPMMILGKVASLIRRDEK